MGSLAENVASVRPKRRLCVFGRWFDELDEEDKQTVRDCFSDSAWTIPKLVLFFATEGCPTREKGMSFHRRGDCVECAEAGL
jgi:hypothetical protein